MFRIINSIIMGYNKEYTWKDEQDALWDVWSEIKTEVDVVRTLPEEISLIELKAIYQALHNNDGNRTKAAAELGIGRTNLIAKIRKYKTELEDIFGFTFEPVPVHWTSPINEITKNNLKKKFFKIYFF